MMKKLLFPIIFVSVFLTACDNQKEKSNAEKFDNSERILARQIEFKRISGSMREIEDMMQAKTAFDAEKIKVLTADLQKSSQNVFQYFSEQDKGGKSKLEIWSNRAEFDSEKDRFVETINKLNEEAQTGDIQKIKASSAPVYETCKSCHDKFKIKHNKKT